MLDKEITGNLLLLDFLLEHLPKFYCDLGKEILIKMIKDGTLKIDRLLELAIANSSNLLHTPTVGRDFDDGSDAKKSIARTHAEGKAYGCNISNITCKEGAIRATCISVKHKTVNLLKIPYTEYRKHLGTEKRKGNIEVPIDRVTGLVASPRRPNSLTRSGHYPTNYKQYVCENWKDFVS